MPVKPSIQTITDGSTRRLQITAATRQELRRVLKGLRRKYPQLHQEDIEQVIATAKDGSYYSSDPLDIPVTFGGAEAGRSLVKAAVALVFDAGVDPGQCDLALNYLLNQDVKPCFWIFLR